MGNILGKYDNLETFLNDIYEKECVIQASDDEIDFIKQGIESLANSIVKDSQKDAANQKFASFCDRHLARKPSLFKVGRHSASKPLLLNVGSFYEGTRNKFPDEFDIIFVDQPSDINSTIKSLHKKLINMRDKSLKYCTFSVSKGEWTKTGELYFHQFIGKIGPAYTCQFIYKSKSGIERHIYLDLVPAVRHDVDETNRDEFTQNVQNQLPRQDSLRDEILKADSYLQIAGNEHDSYTETEVHFMKNVLSSKHRKVYRILKTLINGNGDEKLLEAYLKHIDEKHIFSSYRIKQSMFYHHDKCKNAHDETLGDCVIQILNQLLENHTNKPGSVILLIEKSLPDHLKTLTIHLKEMQQRDGSYDYERAKMKSLPRLYFDELERMGDRCLGHPLSFALRLRHHLWLDWRLRHDLWFVWRQRHALWFVYKDMLEGQEEPSYDSFITKIGIPQDKHETNVQKLEVILKEELYIKCLQRMHEDTEDMFASMQAVAVILLGRDYEQNENGAGKSAAKGQGRI